TDLAQVDTFANINVDSERLSKIKKRVALLSSFPQGISRQDVTETLKKLNSCKHSNDLGMLYIHALSNYQTKNGDFINR
ncbi:MAG: hypothetical protein ACK45T_06895, partial [Pseudanabaena sp.]